MSGGVFNRTNNDWQTVEIARTLQIKGSNKACIKENYTAGKVVLRILATLVVSGGCALGAYYGFKLYAGSTSLTGVFIQLGAAQAAWASVASIGIIWFPYGYEFKGALNAGYLKHISAKLRDAKSYEELQAICFRRNWKRDLVLKVGAKSWVKNGLMTPELHSLLIENIQIAAENRAKKAGEKIETLMDFTALKVKILEDVSPPKVYDAPY